MAVLSALFIVIHSTNTNSPNTNQIGRIIENGTLEKLKSDHLARNAPLRDFGNEANGDI